MALLVTAVLLPEVHVVPADDNSALHLGRTHHTTKNAATNGDCAREGAFLVDVVRLNRFLGNFVAETNVFEVTTLALAAEVAFAVLENVFLLLVRAFGLVRVFGGYDVSFYH